ncbi:MAG: hydrogenase maturation protease [Planctomycetota bacterium]|jgi:coenzyme F420 hydrogenase subunit delta
MDWTPDCFEKQIVVFGCGNILLGDDGFGPAVIEYMENNYDIPDGVALVNAGTGIRKFLFDMVLSPSRPGRIIIIDAVDKGKPPGEIFEVLLENIPREKCADLSFHQAPSSNLLRELRDFCDVDVVVLACQPAVIPEEVRQGLSEIMENKIPEFCDRLIKWLR